MSSGGPPDRSAKRLKGDGPMGGAPPPDGYNGSYGQPPPQGRYQQAPYGPGGPSMGPQSGYMWQQGQYGNPPPPPSWGHASPPPGAMYPQRGGPSMTPDRAGYGSSYSRGPGPIQGSRRGGKPGPPSRPPPKTSDASTGPPGWSHPQGGQWQQHQYGPPGSYGAPMHQSSGYNSSNMYGSNTPPQGGPPQRRQRASPEIMGYPVGPPGSQAFCGSADNPDPDMYHHGMGPHDDDGNSSTATGKDKGRGSYKCGRCGVPKKGHICPYQPRLSRRPGEPLPEMRSAAIQVEMDEFMTLRRLNLKIQGFPESYATEPYLEDDMVVGEPRTAPPPSTPAEAPRGELLTVPDSTVPPSMEVASTQDPVGMLESPMRSSPITDEPITA